MSKECAITRNNKIVGYTVNGEDSVLFDELLKITGNGEDAFNLYKQTRTEEFQLRKHNYKLDKNGEPIIKNKHIGLVNRVEDYFVEPKATVNFQHKITTPASLTQIEKDFENYDEHPDVEYYLKGNVGRITNDTITNLCDMTASVCISYLHSKGVNILPIKFHIYPTLKIANFRGDFNNHKVAMAYIDNKIYIFDMPQNEYITLNKNNQAVIGEFKPRFIEVTQENMLKYYGIDEESYNRTFYGTTPSQFLGTAEINFIGHIPDTYVKFEGNIADYFKAGSPVYSGADFKKAFINKEKNIKPTYTFNIATEEVKSTQPDLSSINRLAKFYQINTQGFFDSKVDFPKLKAEAVKLGYDVKQAESGSYYLTKNGKKYIPEFLKNQTQPKLPGLSLEESSKSLWEKYKDLITSELPAMTQYEFELYPKPVQQKIINCL